MELATHLDLDGAWPATGHVPPIVDARAWGPRPRYLTRKSAIDAFYHELTPKLGPFVLYGSGDFHHLTAALLRRIDTSIHVVCFDNHPDWDIRPPPWACGAWVNRALELSTVQSVSVWGCGNFELAFPSRIFRSRSARLTVHPWGNRLSAASRRYYPCMTPADWQRQFVDFTKSLSGQNVYVTVDLDCLRADGAVTNWENGLFTAADVAWAVRQLRESTRVIGGDICGAYSEPVFATPFQRLAGWWDHPRVDVTFLSDARRVNMQSLDVIWPALVTP